MNVINLTPHAINYIAEDKTIVFQPSGNIARVSVSRSLRVVDGIAMTRPTFGQVEGLPEETADMIYIVSALVRQAASNRLDLISPGELVRDPEGRVIGCKTFDIN